VFWNVQAGDLVTIGLLIVLEGLLSADNALVMAVMVLGLPRDQHRKALRYGLAGAFVFRAAATLAATSLIRIPAVKLLGGLYLFYLTYSHFGPGRGAEDRRNVPAAKPAFGLSAFWATVVRVEMVNLAFSIDSILAAVAMSPKRWVVLTGGLLGIIALRVVVGKLIEIIRRYPALVDGAFVIIAWVGFKLLTEYAYQMQWIHWEVPQPISIGVVIAIFLVSFVYARRQTERDVKK
jgi:YkoY family integral membrane protein